MEMLLLRGMDKRAKFGSLSSNIKKIFTLLQCYIDTYIRLAQVISLSKISNRKSASKENFGYPVCLGQHSE